MQRPTYEPTLVVYGVPVVDVLGLVVIMDENCGGVKKRAEEAVGRIPETEQPAGFRGKEKGRNTSGRNLA